MFYLAVSQNYTVGVFTKHKFLNITLNRHIYRFVKIQMFLVEESNQNTPSFDLVKQDSYVACAKRDKISRYTDIERKNKVERTSRMRSGNQM